MIYIRYTQHNGRDRQWQSYYSGLETIAVSKLLLFQEQNNLFLWEEEKLAHIYDEQNGKTAGVGNWESDDGDTRAQV